MNLIRQEYPPGLYSDLTNAQYHNAKGTGSTGLKAYINATPARIHYDSVNAEHKDNANYNEGSAVHGLLLEPQHWNRDFAVSDVWNLRTNDGKAAKAAFYAENAGKTIIDIEQHERVLGMVEAVVNHPLAHAMLEDIVVEQSVFWNKAGYDREELLKVRPDAVSSRHPLIVDIKTCESAAWSDMQRAILNYQYHLSAAMYLEGCNQCKPLKDAVGVDMFKGFALICVEKKPPYQVACYELDTEFLAIGHGLFLTAFGRMSEARQNNWPGYPPRLRVISPPKWATNIPVI